MTVRRARVLFLLALLGAAAFAGGLSPARAAERIGLSASMTDVRPPEPLGPQPGSKVGGYMPELQVRAYGAVQYHFRVWDAAGGAIVADAYTPQAVWKVVNLLNGANLPEGSYTWSCRAQFEEWSPFFLPRWTFDVRKPDPAGVTDSLLRAPMPAAPIPGTKAQGGSQIMLAVEPVHGAASYHWRVFNSPLGKPTYEATTERPWWNLPVTVPCISGTYYWHCRVSDGLRWGPFFTPAWWYELDKPTDGEASLGIVGASRLPGVSPNPCGVAGCEMLFAAAGSGPVTATVYSAEGRPIRVLEARNCAAGPCRLAWDGRDQSGRRVGAGTYLCRITAGDAQSVVKVIKTR
jgi:hypothetical protein